jgi:hypothetical protein
MSTDQPKRRQRTSPGALVRYAVLWVAMGTVGLLVVVAALRGGGADSGQRADPIATVVASGCVLEQPRGRQARVARPPVSGARSAAAGEGIYDAPRAKRELVGALRRGVVVIQYEPRLAEDGVATLRDAFGTADPPRILAPDASGMPFKVAATAWRRVLGCSKLDATVVRALRAFAQRYHGQGPDN